MRKAYLASIVPVIVNAILNAHQLVIDIVAFVSKGDFPRSRLGEKQRGKILASWVTRKMRTIAQFGIRDSENAADAQITEVAEPHHLHAEGSIIHNGSVTGSSLGHTPSSHMLETAHAHHLHHQQHEHERGSHQAQTSSQGGDWSTLPTGISEMPTNEYDEETSTSRDDDTPTDIHTTQHFELPDIDISFTHSAIPIMEYYNQNGGATQQQQQDDDPETHRYAEDQQHHRGESESPPPPPTPQKDDAPMPLTVVNTPAKSREPSVGGGVGIWSLPSQQRISSSQQSSLHQHQMGSPDGGRTSSRGGGGGGGGLRAINVTSAEERERRQQEEDDEDEWPQEAIMHINLSDNGNGYPLRHDGSGNGRGGGDADNNNGGPAYYARAM